MRGCDSPPFAGAKDGAADKASRTASSATIGHILRLTSGYRFGYNVRRLMTGARREPGSPLVGATHHDGNLSHCRRFRRRPVLMHICRK